jgi:glycosyltransferase involved in cell wall biosynthesis
MSGEPVDFLVVIPTFRRPDFLLEAIKSSLAQQGASKKLVVVDDCPDGSAGPAVRALGSPDVTYLRHPKRSRGGPAPVRNFGFAEARRLGLTARYVHFLDDDDLVPEGYYAAAKAAFAQHPTRGLLFGNLDAFSRFSDDPEKRRRQEAHVRDERAEFDKVARTVRLYRAAGEGIGLPGLTQWLYTEHALYGHPLFFCGSCLIRSELVDQLGGFPEDIRLTEDLRFFGHGVRRFGAHFLDRPAVHYRMSDRSLTRSQDIPQAERLAEVAEIRSTLRQWQSELKAELGAVRFWSGKIAYRVIIRPLIERVILPLLSWRAKR